MALADDIMYNTGIIWHCYPFFFFYYIKVFINRPLSVCIEVWFTLGTDYSLFLNHDSVPYTRV